MNTGDEFHRFLSSAVHQSSEGIAIADLNGHLLYINPAWAEMHGYQSAEELIGKSFHIFHNEAQIEKLVKPFIQVVFDKGRYSGQMEHIRKDGTSFTTHMTTTLLKDDQENPTAILALALDITEQKNAEEALRDSQLKYMAIVTNIPGMIYKGFSDWSSEIISGGKTLCGYSSRELNSLEGGWAVLIHPHDKERVFTEGNDELQEVAKSLVQVYRIIHKNGNIKWVEDRKTSIFSDNGEFESVYGVVFDITSRKKVEQELINERNKLQKALDEVKTLRGIIPICMYCHKIKAELGDWNKLETYIEEHSTADFTHGICPDCLKEQLEEVKKIKGD